MIMIERTLWICQLIESPGIEAWKFKCQNLNVQFLHSHFFVRNFYLMLGLKIKLSIVDFFNICKLISTEIFTC